MTYEAAIAELNAMAPELATMPGMPRRKFSLEEIRRLLQALGDPHRQFRSVLVAGTNGKGSTASTLASILNTAGIRAGLYTSPHLQRVNERIRVAGVEIGDAHFSERFFRVHQTAQVLVAQGQLAQFPSFFEILTTMAFLEFADAGVEIAVLEVGMGGRLDATNVVEPIVSVITDIALDHMEWLGSTLQAIAREKAGILRSGGVLITLPQHPEANQAIGEVATTLAVRGVNAAIYMPPFGTAPGQAYSTTVLGQQIEVASPLHGAHQQRNVSLAIAAAVELAQHHGLPITCDAIAEGVRHTRWPGRLEVISRADGEWILDVAHNPAGAWALRAGLREDLERSICKVLVFSCLRDKPLDEMAQILFPLFDRIVFAPIASPRATPTSEMMSAAARLGCTSIAAPSVNEAISQAASIAERALIVVSGSVYLVGEARSLLLDSVGGGSKTVL